MEERKHKVQEITSPQIRPAQIWGLSKLALSCWSLRLNTQPARLNHGGFQSLGEISAVHFKDVCKSPQEAVFTLTLLTFQPDVFVHLRLCLSSTGAERRWFLEGLVLGSVHTISTFSVFCIKNCIWWPWAWYCVYSLSASMLEMDTCLGSITFSFNLALMRQLHVERPTTGLFT